MPDQHVKGAVSTAKGVVEEAIGKVSGDQTLEAKGIADKIQGKARGSLGDAADAVKRVRQH